MNDSSQLALMNLSVSGDTPTMLNQIRDYYLTSKTSFLNMVSPIKEYREEEEVKLSELSLLQSDEEDDTMKLTKLEKVDQNKSNADINTLSQEQIENNPIVMEVHNYTFPFKISTPFPLSPITEAAQLEGSLSDISIVIQDIQTPSMEQNCFDDRFRNVESNDRLVTNLFGKTSEMSPLNLLDNLNISSLTDTSDDDLQYKIQLITPFIEEHESLLSEMNKVMILYNYNINCF